MIDIVEKQGRKTLELKDAELVYIGEVETGNSQRTGRQWQSRCANIRFNVGTNMEGKTEFMSMAVKCYDEICEKIGMIAIGTHLKAFVRVNLNLYFKKPSTDCTLVDFTL